MRRAVLTVALSVMVSVFTAGSATAAKPRPSEGASGKFTLTVHTHSSQFRGPGGAALLFETDPLPFNLEEGKDFSYSSVACEDPARFNDVALNFSPDYPGIQDPAAVRHFVEGTVVDVDESGETGEIEGTIITFLCEDGEEGDQVFFEFEGTFERISDNELRFSGTFVIEGGTGRFEDITGEGKITAEFTCLPGVLESEDEESCADLGVFSDFVAQLSGDFSDPTT